MANIQFIMVGPPDKHKDFINEINKWKYEMEGNRFKGQQSPVVSEVKMYDVRVPDEIAAQFARDLGLRTNLNSGAVTSKKVRFFNKLFNFIRKRFSPYDEIEVAEGPKKYSLPSWYYCFTLGKIKRNKMKVEIGEDREVL